MEISTIDLSKYDGYGITIGISPIKLNKAKSAFYDLFESLGIDEEKHLSIFKCMRSESDPNLSDRTVIKFKVYEDMQSFYDRVQQGSDFEEFDLNILSVKKDEDDDTESLKSFSVISKAEETIPTMLVKEVNISQQSHIVNYKNNKVEFQIRPNITKNDTYLLELIILFVQSRKFANAGDISDYEFNEKYSTLLVTYEDVESKRRVLSKRSYDIKQYKLYPNEPIDESAFRKLHNYLILRNISANEDDPVVSLYVDNLVQDNEIVELKKSKIFTDTFIVEFEKDIKMEEVVSRHKRRPQLRDKQTVIMEAFETKTIVALYDNRVAIGFELAELHFMNSKKSGFEKYVNMREVDPFVIIEVENEQDANNCVTKTHMLMNKMVLVEKCFNIMLVNEEIEIIKNSQVEKEEKKSIVSVEGTQSQSSIKSQTISETAKPKFEPMIIDVSKCKYKYQISDLSYFTLKPALSKCARIMEDLKLALKSKKMELIMDKSNEMWVESKEYTTEQKELFNAIAKKVLEEFKQKIEFKLIIIPSGLSQRTVDIQSLCDRMNDTYDCMHLTLRANNIDFYGYATALKNVEAELENVFKRLASVDVNSQVKPKEKFEFKLSDTDEKKVKILFDFNESFFKSLYEELVNKKSFKCLCEKNIVDGVRILKITSDESYEGTEKNFRELINQYMSQFFEKFKIIQFINNDVTGADMSAFIGEKGNVRVDKLNENTFEISGLRDDVDHMKIELENAIKEYETNKKSEAIEKEIMQVDEVKKDDNEPFLDNLKLYQIRMLLMLKYRTEMNKHQNLKVTVDTKNMKILYEGNPDEITMAKSRALSVFDAIRSNSYKLEPIRIRFLLKNETSLVRWLNENKLTCVIEFNQDDESCLIYSINEEDIQKCFDMLNRYVVVRTYKYSEKDDDKVDQFVANENAKLLWAGDTKTTNYTIEKGDDSRVLICGYEKLLEHVTKSLEDKIKVLLV